MSSPPLSPTEQYEDDVDQEESGSQSPATTRTVAIIKTHALKHRFDIEPRILESSFEIVKERQMEFDTEADPEFLEELFGEDAQSLAEGPVWVYVLERRRAVEVWNTLMGDRDPAIAQQTVPNSLRALYGTSLEQNGLMGSPNAELAEVQIASLFASSPPFPTSELPEDLSTGNYGDSNGSQRPRMNSSGSGGGRSRSSTEARLAPNGKKLFKARALPKTHVAPDIAPRTTKAAALRAGIVLEKPSANGPRVAPTRAQLKQAFMDVPGHKRSSVIAVASTAAPAIAPRMTKAAQLRIQKDQPKSPQRIRPSPSSPAASKAKAKVKENTDVPEKKNTFEGVPGHKRRESIPVASTAAPTIVPRANKSAALRASKDPVPPSSFQFRTPSAGQVPTRARSNSQDSLSTSRPASVASISRPPSVSRQSSTTSVTDSEEKPKRARPSSLGLPSIAPRPNKSAMLRAAQKEKEAEAVKGRTSTNRSVFV